VKVTWNCGMSVGPAYWYWSGDWVYGPDECSGDGEFEIDPEEWEEMTFPMDCSSCGQEMDPFCDHFTADTGETSQELYTRVIEAP
jgi:hypothetical protein